MSDAPVVDGTSKGASDSNICASRLRKMIISDNKQVTPGPPQPSPEADVEYDEMILDLPAAEDTTAAESAIAAGYEITQDSPYYEMYMQITRKFQQPEAEEKKEEVPTRGEVFDDDNEVTDDEEEKALLKLGKKKRKLADLLSVSELRRSQSTPKWLCGPTSIPPIPRPSSPSNLAVTLFLFPCIGSSNVNISPESVA